MKLVTVVGPLTSESDARDTAKQLGEVNHSVYYRSIQDDLGLELCREWYVERDNDIVNTSTIFGYSWDYINAKQRKR